MISAPLISVIVPAYNNPGELKECLRSVKENDIADRTELIVVDDCSTEDNGEIERVTKMHEGRYFRMNENSGPGMARNLGASKARGEILAFIDSDCIAPKDWLSGLTQPVRDGRYKATTACYSGPVVPGWITVFQDDDYRYRMPSRECDVSFVNSCNMSIDRKVFLECGGFPDQRISEDMVLGINLSRRGTPARYLPSSGVRHTYYRNLVSYLKQRFSFAFHTVQSYVSTGKMEEGETNVHARSFSVPRTASGMLFGTVALMGVSLAFILSLFGSDLAVKFLMAGFTGLFLETMVHGPFLFYLMKRQGIWRALSYTMVLYLTDVVYVFAVLKAAGNAFLWSHTNNTPSKPDKRGV